MGDGRRFRSHRRLTTTRVRCDPHRAREMPRPPLVNQVGGGFRYLISDFRYRQVLTHSSCPTSRV